VELGKGSWVVEGDHKLRASEREAGHRDARWLVEGGAAEMGERVGRGETTNRKESKEGRRKEEE
jgi:hypothetical protein